ncbi:hypothetical protein KVR01_007300 [Diaporthe batatas]|uniref:uncharacterized protein n=1 Tax=Diaporthe batatas TaxID=748121 RepID=UPI001D0592DB|nr:uncharacterized protein KVR01_007300 [Diaporthe batatas]KAG8162822.1 hypothetical protein KVR01_007300 [Diaporthe batatas]
MAMSWQVLAWHKQNPKTSWAPLVFAGLVTTLFLLLLQNNSYPSRISNLIDQPEDKIPPQKSAAIPDKLWQIFLPPNNAGDDFTIHPAALIDVPSWLARNPDYHYRLVTSKWADAFVDAQFGPESEIAKVYHELRNPGLKSDLLRYLILFIEGGVYTDTDTEGLQPIDKWVGWDMKDRVKLIVGVEFDQRDGGPWADIPHVLQFCQWTIAAAPGHPIFPDMVARSLGSLKELSATYNKSLGDMKPSSFEVMNSTGPAAWTEVVFAHLQKFDPGLQSLRDLSSMKNPRLYGALREH